MVMLTGKKQSIKNAARCWNLHYPHVRGLFTYINNSCIKIIMVGSRVKFLVDTMERLGCKMRPGFFSIIECEKMITGGFHLDEENNPGV